MISIGMIFIALATTALAKGSIECIFSELTGVQLCFGAVGQLLIFHLPNTTNAQTRLKKDNKYTILDIKNQKVTQLEEYADLYEYTNGTIKLGNAMKTHSGNYLLEEYGSDGVLQKTVNVRLEIQAPVSKPAVSQMCLSPELMNISCSSEGDEVEFNLTLNGVLLVPTRGYSQSLSNMTVTIESPTGSKTDRDKPSVLDVNISFQDQLTGNLTCHVRNKVSRDETVIHLTGCKDFVSSFPVMTVAVAASGVTLLLLVALCLGIITLHKKPRSTTVTEDNTEDEVVYASVRIIKNTRETGSNSHQSATYEPQQELNPTLR